MKAPENRTARQDVALAEVQSANKRLYRAFLLKEQLRELYRVGISRAATGESVEYSHGEVGRPPFVPLTAVRLVDLSRN